MRILAATGNKGKLREFAQCASGEGIEVRALPGLDSIPEPVEDAATFAGNAALKAVAYSRQAPGEWVLADDSGLEVEALGGAPGVRSARYAEDAGFGIDSGMTKDERNNALLLDRLGALAAGGRSSDRRAEFVCALAVARDGVVEWQAEGRCKGLVLEAARGDGGFGYDPLFLLPERGKTMGELTPEEKWRVSHRGQAFRALLDKVTKAR